MGDYVALEIILIVKVKTAFLCVCEMRQQGDGPTVVIALQDYPPMGDNDLPLQKGQEYVLINSSNSDWWAVRSNTG